MRTFTVHGNASLPRAEDHVRFVKEGMAGWAIVSPLIWFLYHRMWWEGAAYFGLSILIAVAGGAVGFQASDNPVTSAVMDRSGSAFRLGTGVGQAATYTKPKGPVWPKRTANNEAQSAEPPRSADSADEVLGLFPRPHH